ncbi:MAG TPA: PAS domain S-box protein [Thermoanaerobaculia bacterium]|nr:PAS domain S-box protein [Thermoanaerobaculia bacterium]
MDGNPAIIISYLTLWVSFLVGGVAAALLISLVILRQRKPSRANAVRVWEQNRIARLKDLYERILENLVTGVFVTDASGRVYYVNAAMRNLSSILPHEIGEQPRPAQLPRSLAPFTATYAAAERALTAVQFDSISVRCCAGQERLHSGWMIPLTAEGVFDGMICITEDMTARKRVEEELRASRDHLDELISLTTDWVWECDEHGRYTNASARVSDVLGYSPEEVIGKTACELAPPDEVENAARVLKPLLEHPGPFVAIEVVGQHRNGQHMLLEVSGIPLLATDGALIGYRGVASNITERESNKRERQRLATAIECAEDVLIITDRDGRIEYANPAFVTVTGYSREAARGFTPRDILDSGDHSQDYYDDMRSHLLGGNTWVGHFVNVRRDGGFYHADVTISPIFDDEGAINGFVAVQRDVTEKLELIQRLNKAVEMERFGNLVSGVAHEVRNPLNAIQAAAAALELDYGGDPEARELFDVVRSQVDRLAQLMRDLLTVGKPIDQRWLQRRRATEVVSEAVHLWRGGHPELNHAAVHFHHQSDAEVLVDAMRMHQVIVNLLDNALQHGGGDAEIVISVVDTGNECRISVSDSGRGIDAADFERVFEPFFTTRRGGTGLGLAIVKSIVQRHGGRVGPRSNYPEPGCTFEIVLPAERSVEKMQEACA